MWWNKLRVKIFGEKLQQKDFCFRISNREEVWKKDPEAFEKLERECLELGALPGGLPMGDGINQFCVYVEYKEDLFKEHPYFSVEKMLALLKKHGCRAEEVKN
jgi:hypothetical protein